MASLSLASENRETIARVGGFDALLSCLCDNDDTAARDTRRPATSGTADVTDATVSSAALKKLTTIVSLKSAAKRAIKRTRHYAIKRLAIECIANLLEERKTHERFLSRGGMETFQRLLIQERNSVLIQEQKSICHALYHLSKNESIRKPMYERGFMSIVKALVNDEETELDLTRSILRSLRLLTLPVIEETDKKSGNASTTRLAPRIPWTSARFNTPVDIDYINAVA